MRDSQLSLIVPKAKGKSEDVTMLGAADVVRPNGKRKRLDLTKPKSLQEQVPITDLLTHCSPTRTDWL